MNTPGKCIDEERKVKSVKKNQKDRKNMGP